MAFRNRILAWAGVRASQPADSDSLAVFGSEEVPPAPALRIVPPAAAPAPAAVARAPRNRRYAAVVVAGLLLTAAVSAGAYWWMKVRLLTTAPAATGTVTIESDPPGADVFAGEELKGTTPLTLTIAAGAHSFDVVRDGRRKPVVAVARPGTLLVHHVQFEAAAPAATTASLEVITDPASLRVFVDGELRGVSPLTVSALAPGRHVVQVRGPAGAVERQVDLVAGQAGSIVIGGALAAPVQTAGWLVVSSPVPVQVSEGGELLGSSDQPRIMLASGGHNLVLSNRDLGFSETRSVRVVPGASQQITLTLPMVPMAINALPWAEAWIDGVRIGETPIANHPVRLGVHELVFRHPEFGERRQTVTVRLGVPARASVDMRRP